MRYCYSSSGAVSGEEQRPTSASSADELGSSLPRPELAETFATGRSRRLEPEIEHMRHSRGFDVSTHIAPKKMRSKPASVFWDIENCPLPADVLPETISYKIHNRISSFFGPGVFQVRGISAYGDFHLFPRRIREGCQRVGINMIDVPNGRKDAADKAILTDMFLFALDHPPPACIFLISGDVDFAAALHKLHQRNYFILLSASTSVPIAASLLLSTACIWDWKALARGQLEAPQAVPITLPDPSPEKLPHSVTDTAGSQPLRFQTPSPALSMSTPMPDTRVGEPSVSPSACSGSRAKAERNNSPLLVPSHVQRKLELNEGPSDAIPNEDCEPVLKSEESLEQEGVGDALATEKEQENVPVTKKIRKLRVLKQQLTTLLQHHGGKIKLSEVPDAYESLFGLKLKMNRFKVTKVADLINKMNSWMGGTSGESLAVVRKKESKIRFLVLGDVALRQEFAGNVEGDDSDEVEEESEGGVERGRRGARVMEEEVDGCVSRVAQQTNGVCGEYESGGAQGGVSFKDEVGFACQSSEANDSVAFSEEQNRQQRAPQAESQPGADGFWRSCDVTSQVVAKGLEVESPLNMGARPGDGGTFFSLCDENGDETDEQIVLWGKQGCSKDCLLPSSPAPQSEVCGDDCPRGSIESAIPVAASSKHEGGGDMSEEQIEDGDPQPSSSLSSPMTLPRLMHEKEGDENELDEPGDSVAYIGDSVDAFVITDPCTVREQESSDGESNSCTKDPAECEHALTAILQEAETSESGGRWIVESQDGDNGGLLHGERETTNKSSGTRSEEIEGSECGKEQADRSSDVEEKGPHDEHIKLCMEDLDVQGGSHHRVHAPVARAKNAERGRRRSFSRVNHAEHARRVERLLHAYSSWHEASNSQVQFLF